MDYPQPNYIKTKAGQIVKIPRWIAKHLFSSMAETQLEHAIRWDIPPVRQKKARQKAMMFLRWRKEITN